METTYLKLFKNHSEYNVEDTPNVSYCETENEVHYNPVETRLIVKYNITNTSAATNICNNSNNFSELEIDGVVQPNVINSYTFDTTGEHIIKYTLTNPTFIDQYAFQNCKTITNVVIPKTVTIIKLYAFNKCSGLASIVIPGNVISIYENAFMSSYLGESLTISEGVVNIADSAFKLANITDLVLPSTINSIGLNAFSDCNIKTITSYASNPPAIGIPSLNFAGANVNKIYVPAESVETYKEAGGWSSYSNKIQAIS